MKQIVERWDAAGHRRRFGSNNIVLEARGPSKRGLRTVIAVYADERVFVPFSSYGGSNTGIPIDALTTDAFRREANTLFGFGGYEQQARTTPNWLRPERVDELVRFCMKVADAYAAHDMSHLTTGSLPD